MPKNIGVMPGSFDPPHTGHVKTAFKAKTNFNLSTVLMMPITQSPTKIVEHPTPFTQKLEMCEIISESHDWLQPSTLAKDFSTTPLGCLQDLKHLFEQLSANDNLFVVSGADFNRRLSLALRALKVSQRLAHMTSLYIPIQVIKDADMRLEKACGVFNRVSAPACPRSGTISSSQIRNAIQAAEWDGPILSPSNIPVKVLQCIKKNRLYPSKVSTKEELKL